MPGSVAGYSEADSLMRTNPSAITKDLDSRFSKALSLGSYFVSGCLAVNISQVLGGPLYLINKDWYNSWIAFTKQSFGLLVTTMTQQWAPTLVRVSGDKSVRGQILKTVGGEVYCDFPQRLVMMSNHQIYTDWLYLWWIAFTAGMHGRVYIVLKESLKRIPVIGWGMQLSQFIFLKRNWEKDKPHLSKHLQTLNKPSDPMWLVIFPEGTNLAPSTRKASKKWADKNDIEDMQHQLLPRSTGLQFCLQELRRTVDYVYDCTIAYEGVPRGQYAQDIFTLRASYFEGNPPPCVNMYWRRFKVSTIPLDDPKAFEIWLRTRWREKDMLIERFYRKGRFPPNLTSDGRSAGYVESQVKSSGWNDMLQIFAPVGLIALVLYTFYGALPKLFTKGINKKAQKDQIAAAKNRQIPSTPETRMVLGPQAKAILDQVEAARKGLNTSDAVKLLMGPAGKGVLQQLEAIANGASPTEAVLNKFNSVRKSGLSESEMRLLTGPAGRGVIQKLLENRGQFGEDEMRLLTGPAGRGVLEKLLAQGQGSRKQLEGALPITETRLNALNAAQGVAQHPAVRALATSKSVKKSAPPSVVTTTTQPAQKRPSGKPVSVATTTTKAPSVASMPVKRAPLVALPDRSSSVAPTPKKKQLVTPASNRASSVTSMPASKAPTVVSKAPTAVSKNSTAASKPKSLMASAPPQPSKANVVNKQTQKPAIPTTKPKTALGITPMPKKPTPPKVAAKPTASKPVTSNVQAKPITVSTPQKPVKKATPAEKKHVTRPLAAKQQATATPQPANTNNPSARQPTTSVVKSTAPKQPATKQQPSTGAAKSVATKPAVKAPGTSQRQGHAVAPKRQLVPASKQANKG